MDPMHKFERVIRILVGMIALAAISLLVARAAQGQISPRNDELSQQRWEYVARVHHVADRLATPVVANPTARQGVKNAASRSRFVLADASCAAIAFRFWS